VVDLYCLETLYHSGVTDAVTVTDNSFSHESIKFC
jgi:hypothetical protein